VIPPSVLAALDVADGRPSATETPGTTFYGTCGATAYAVSSFRLGAGGTEADSVAFQDGGVYPELFRNTGTGWRELASGNQLGSCPSSPLLPVELRTIWHDCAIATTGTPSPTPTTCAEFEAGRVFVRLKTVTVARDGSAVLTGNPVTVHCGGPDDFQFVDGTGTTTVDLEVGGTVDVVGADDEPAPLDVHKLAAYVASGGETDVFLVTGTEVGTVDHATAVAEQFHP
jgi:hypothetical protein